MVNRNTIILISTTILATGAGFAAGYFIGRNRIKKQTDDIIMQMNDEINDYVRQIESYNIQEKIKNNSDERTPEQEEATRRAKELIKKNDEMKMKYLEKIRNSGYGDFKISEEERARLKNEIANMTDEERLEFVTRDEDEEERIARNEAAGLESDEDYEARTNGLEEDIVTASAVASDLPPYIIDETEYIDPQFEGFSKNQFTYFGDGTLIDDSDEIIPNPDDVVGFDNLAEFEGGSKDRIFVRNEKYVSDYEILYKEMSYSEFMGA